MLSAEMYQGSNRENRVFLFFILSPPVLRDWGREYNPRSGNSVQGHTFTLWAMLWPFSSLCWMTGCPFLFSLFSILKEPLIPGPQPSACLLSSCLPLTQQPNALSHLRELINQSHCFSSICGRDTAHPTRDMARQPPGMLCLIPRPSSLLGTASTKKLVATSSASSHFPGVKIFQSLHICLLHPGLLLFHC